MGKCDCMSLHVPHTYVPDIHEGQKMLSDLQELELTGSWELSYRDKNQTHSLWTISKHFQPMSFLLSPWVEADLCHA